jgi:putative endopeptidase
MSPRLLSASHRVFWCVVMLACAPSHAPQPAAAPLANQIDPTDRDTTCLPCTDFYQYAEGGWIARAVIPPAQPAVSMSSDLVARAGTFVRELVLTLAADAKAGRLEPGTSRWKIGTFFASCMDTVAINAAGIEPVRAHVALVDAIRTPTDVMRAFGAIHNGGPGGLAPFDLEPQVDPANSRQYTGTLTQEAGFAGLDRDFYFRDDDRSRSLRETYAGHVERMLMLLGLSAESARAEARSVMVVETALARVSMTREATRDEDQFYHPMSMAQFRALTPHVDWDTFIAALNGRVPPHVNVRTLPFFIGFDSLLVAIPVEQWRAFLHWRIAKASAAGLGTAFTDEAFRWSQAQSGVPLAPPRAGRCLAATNNVLGDAIGVEYVKQNFSDAQRARAMAIVANVVDVMRERLAALDWLSPETKAEALRKVATLDRQVGFPRTPRDFSSLRIEAGSYLRNVEAAWEFSTGREWKAMGGSVDRTQWRMTPQTVNALYDQTSNRIIIPAANLQPPVFALDADEALVYGSIGALVGHEFGHAFDPIGRHWDANGNRRDWWTAADVSKYERQTQIVIDQFNAYTVVDSVTHVNGRLTLEENVADLEGVRMAYRALERAIRAGRVQPLVDGFTPAQRFFIGYARGYRTKMREPMARMMAVRDVHAPPKWRVNGPLSMMPEFQAAWGCKSGDAMTHPDASRAKFW